MQIHCPICSTAIEVPETHVGEKGRCMKCQTKFIIPATPDGEFQILERGQAPAAAAVPRAATPAAPAAAKATTAKKLATPAAKKPALKAATGAPAQRPLPMRPRPKKGGAIGFWIMAGAVGVAMVALFPKLAGDKSGGGGSGKSASDTPATKPGTGQPQRPPTPIPPQPPPVEPEVAAVDEEDPSMLDLTPTATAGETEPGAPASPPQIDEAKKARALAFLKSDQPNKREGAYAALRKLGDPYKGQYKELLAQARGHHLKVLGDKAFNISVDDQSLVAFEQAYEGWQSTAATARKLVQTNWKGQIANKNELRAKHAEMDAAYTEAEAQFGKLNNALKNAGGTGIDALKADVAILAEISGELAWCEGEGRSEAADLRDLLNEAGGADGFLKSFDMLSGALKARDEFEAVAEHNRDSHWATSTYKAFATLLNGRRAVLGLGALRLDEKLSNACEGHSGDMLFKGYFAHTGADGSTFGQRARQAGFSGNATGECIFMGSSSGTAAHNAWWYSDGHRTIMYASPPNTLGLGSAAGYWTLNTGKKRW